MLTVGIKGNSKDVEKAIGAFINKFPKVADSLTYEAATKGKKTIIKNVNATTETRTGALKKGFVVEKEGVSEYEISNIATSQSKPKTPGHEYYANHLEYGTNRGIKARHFVKDAIPEIQKKFEKRLRQAMDKLWSKR